MGSILGDFEHVLGNREKAVAYDEMGSISDRQGHGFIQSDFLVQ
jgi:hypothetical protein